jgi:hypothetical protein
VARRERVGSSLVGTGFLVSILALVSLVTGSASADWEVYVAPGVGISGAIVDTNGLETSASIDLFGSDEDSSPLLDFAVGVEVPMDEILPREWMLDVRPPNWPVRIELETAGLREYELRTKTSNPDDFFTELKATTLLWNVWVDIPLGEIYRPVQSIFRLGRQPRVRRWIEPASFYLGVGIGVGFLDVDGTTNVLSAVEEPIDFAWNVGAGFNYALTDRVSLSAGYRYVGLGKQKIDLDGPVQNSGDKVKFDPEVHELRISIRFQIYDFLSPWRRLR